MSTEYNNFDKIKEIVKKEFVTFDLKNTRTDFIGGRFKTQVPGVYAHVNECGDLKRIEINKPNTTKIFLRV